MKIGMPTLIELPDINETINLCEELGLSFIELNMNMPDFCPENLSPSLVRTISEDKNIEFTLHLPEEIDLASFHQSIRQGNLERCCEAITWAFEAGISLVNLHINSGIYFTLPSQKVWIYEKYKEQFLQNLVTSFNKLLKTVENSKVKICKEAIRAAEFNIRVILMNQIDIDTSKMFSLNNLHLYEEDQEFIDQTLELSKHAITYLENHEWCLKVKNILFDRGFGYPLGVFFVEIEPNGPDVDNFMWVIIGDIPPAYMDIEICKNGAQALDAYVYCMQEWVDHVFQGESVEDLIPVNAPPEIEYAEMLKSRLEFIKDYLKVYEEELG